VTTAAGGAAYVELTVDAGAEAAEALANFLWEQGAAGVVEESAGDGRPRLRAFFPAGAAIATLGARVERYVEALRALGLAAAVRAPVKAVADADWAAAWREHFRPLAVGRGLLVAPPWTTPATADRLLLTIEPGRAFGTGHHGTTAGCLTLLETLVGSDRPTRVIDLGTGSGILAVAAARLGVADVLACDVDPDAIAAARANAQRNGVGARVRAVVEDAARLTADPAPLVVANLLAAAHRALAPRYSRLVVPGGALVLGGLLDAEAESVADTLGLHGFAREATVRLEGWTSLALRHAALHAAS
jgi:ribosomal protein L11 methyltransferase